MRTTGKATDLITFSRSSGGTYLDSDGVLKTASADIPRIEYDANGNVLGLLVEEARVNLLPYSEDFNNPVWGSWGSGASVVSNALEGPDGQLSMDLLTPLANGGGKLDFVSVTGSTNYTLSVFLKVTLDSSMTVAVSLYESGVGTKGFATLTFVDRVPSITSESSINSSVTHIGNGIYRLSVTVASGSGSNNHAMVITGGQINKAFYAYGAQIEQGSFPTSYIPTSGSTATRAADVASIATSEFGYRQDEGTVVVEFRYVDPQNEDSNYVLSAGSNARFAYNNAGSSPWYLFDGSLVGNFSAISESSGAFYKIGLTSDGSSYASTVDGAGLLSGSANPFQSAGVNFGIGNLNNNAHFLNGHIRSVKYIPRRLTNDQLQEITS